MGFDTCVLIIMKMTNQLAYLGGCHHDAKTTSSVGLLAVLRFRINYKMPLLKICDIIGDRSYFLAKEEVKGIKLLLGV